MLFLAVQITGRVFFQTIGVKVAGTTGWVRQVRRGISRQRVALNFPATIRNS
jgi:hypothetical protein